MWQLRVRGTAWQCRGAPRKGLSCESWRAHEYHVWKLMLEHVGETQVMVQHQKQFASGPTKRNSYDTCVLRLTRFRAQAQASKSVGRVCIVFPRHCTALFLAQVSKHRLASVFPTPGCSCRSGHVVVDWSCWKLPHRSADRIRSSARDACLPIKYLCSRHAKTHLDLSLVSVVAGRISTESRAPREVSGEGGAFLFNFVAGFAVGVVRA